jgi:hypothetical protein
MTQVFEDKHGCNLLESLIRNWKWGSFFSFYGFSVGCSCWLMNSSTVCAEDNVSLSLSLSDTHMVVYRTPSTVKIKKKRERDFFFLLSRGSVFNSGWGHLGPFIHTQHELNRACSKCNLVLSNTRNLAAI